MRRIGIGTLLSVGVVFEDWWTRRLELLAAEQGIVIVTGIGNGRDVCLDY